ncbi:hypothetical protein CONPUDRAFT_145211 [Coniophora puteana RWD-64-598 SS2]|uniref:Uncharacterized protein n=1 Tax=Coniophora puteana (strain RWD-64-598) TaxID=741705 RepID=A0A5M3MJ03_CONPW|nr:uncharacterized protein CONPUDRAFT_145211 [Coniophora puteana RWD-64-598 SS2]EIW79016.1 hypothetical protein CONPUDRAFT_145211 [Coniophora puteana RWD-64-598 SS2]
MLNLPTELALQVIALLDTCTTLRDLTYDRTLWLGLYHWVRSFLPVPTPDSPSSHDPRAHNSSSLETLSQPSLEKLVVASLQVERSWLLPRPRILTRLVSPSAPMRSELSLSSLEFVRDRYLLAVYEQGMVDLWYMDTDMDKDGQWKDMKLYAWYAFDEDLGVLSSAHEVSVSEDGEVLYVAVTLAEVFITRIISIRLDAESANTIQRFDVVNGVDLSSPRVVRAIDVESGIALFSHVSSMDVVNWRTNTSVPITVHADDDLEELWNGITAMTFCGPYIVCFRARSIELYPIPSLPDTAPSSYTPHYPHLPVLIHRFSHITFRRVSVSHRRPSPSTSPSSSLPTSYTLSFVGYDVFHGLFQCLLTLTLAPVPSLTFALAALHPVGIARDMVHAYASVFGAGAGKPAFVGAWALGPQGRRGVWVERMRESLTTSLYAFSWDRTRQNVRPRLKESVVVGEGPEDGDGAVDDSDAVDGIVVETEAESSDEEEVGFVRVQTGVPLMDGKIVMEVPSIDLREDITLCALSEATGRIALGLRSGSIKIV